MEHMSDQSALPNLNANWVNAKGMTFFLPQAGLSAFCLWGRCASLKLGWGLDVKPLCCKSARPRIHNIEQIIENFGTWANIAALL